MNPPTVPCPTCAAALRVPAGAATIRCPRCKTVFAPPGVAAPPPPPVAKAIPLALEAPTAPPPPPPAVAAAAPRRPVARGKLVREEEEPAEDRRTPAARIAERDKAEELRKYDRAEELAKPARVGLRLMAFGAMASCLASVVYFFAQIATFGGSGLLFPLLILSGVLLAAHWTLTIVGFVFCGFGPRAARGTAAAGAVVMVLHLGVTIPTFIVVGALFSLDGVGFQNLNGKGSVAGTLLLGNVFNNLSVLTDLPVYLLNENMVKPQILLLPILGAAFEFAKLSIVGVVTHHLATAGKDSELAHQALRFVYRIFWLVIAGVVMKLSLWSLVKLTGGEPLLLMWFSIPVSMMTLGYFLWWAFAWGAQYRVILDTVEVLDARRMTDPRDRLDAV